MTDQSADTPYGGVDNLEVMKEARNYNAFLEDLVRRQIGSRGALDFGAGAGTFALPLAQTGIPVRCVEPDPTLRARLHSLGLEAYADLAAVPPASLDFAYSLNVLEHIEDDCAALAELFRRLKPGGRLLVYVPAFQLLYSSMDRKVGHLRRYTRGMLVERLRAAGFAVDDARYCDSLGFLASLVFKAIGNDAGEIDRRALVLYDRFAFPLSRALDLACSSFFGKNVFALARRP